MAAKAVVAVGDKEAMVAFFIKPPAFLKNPLFFFFRGVATGVDAVGLVSLLVFEVMTLLFFLRLLIAFLATNAVVAVGDRDAIVAFLINLPAFFKKPLLFFFRGFAVGLDTAEGMLLLVAGVVLAAMLADGTTGIGWFLATLGITREGIREGVDALASLTTLGPGILLFCTPPFLGVAAALTGCALLDDRWPSLI